VDILDLIPGAFLRTMRDILPLIALIAFFQIIVLRKRPANLRRVIVGFVYVVVGLAFFTIGLENALFPLGRTMADQDRKSVV